MRCTSPHEGRAHGLPRVGQDDGVRGADARAFATELALADLVQVEKKVERMKKEKGSDRELALFARLQQALEEGRALRTLGLTADEQTALAGFAFLSLRPLLVVLNVPEG